MRVSKLVIVLIVFMSIGIIVSACSDDIDTNMSESIADFDFTTQDNKSLSLDDLKGSWWITYFSYTNCQTVCPRTTDNMVKVQNELKSKDLNLPIVSFNVDPERDTPSDLKEYANEYGVDLDTWDFLTGYDFDTIQEISEDSFQATLEKGAANQMAHSYMFYLINPNGKIIKEYDGMGNEGPKELVNDVEIVLD